ncbi:MAG: glycosyltransferase family 4 protein [Candidatus Paceibacterota bacterium]
MKLLICTQKVDINDSILGFFHRWIEEFSQHFEKISVICLEEGEYNLPDNVHVYSLGKEEWQSRIQYVLRFYQYIWRLRKEYSHIFVHMNPEHIILGGFFWKLANKKIGLWYNHTVGSFWLRISWVFCDWVFHTSPFAYTARYNKSLRMPAGINLDIFKLISDVKKRENSIYFQGRVTVSKRVHVLLESFAILRKRGIHALLTVVGPEEDSYITPFKQKYSDYIDKKEIMFLGGKKHDSTVNLFNAHEVCVNLTDDGNYDKTVLEAMACGCIPVVASIAFEDVIPNELRPESNNPLSVAECIEYALSLSPEKSRKISHKFRLYVERNHSLTLLSERLYNTFARL